MAKKRYDTEFSIRLKMALYHTGIDWTSPQAVGTHFGRPRQTTHQWLTGTIPDSRDELWLVEEKLKDTTAKWLITGKDTPKWASVLDPDKFRKAESQEILTTRRKRR